MWNWDQILTGEVHDVWVGGFRIENPDGAWQMRPIVNFTLPDGTRTVWTGIFDGEGDYDGLTAIAEVTEGRSRYALRGIVIDGEDAAAPRVHVHRIAGSGRVVRKRCNQTYIGSLGFLAEGPDAAVRNKRPIPHHRGGPWLPLSGGQAISNSTACTSTPGPRKRMT